MAAQAKAGGLKRRESGSRRRRTDCAGAPAARPASLARDAGSGPPLAGQNVGIKEVSDRSWVVTFVHYDLGFFNHETCRLELVADPFEPKVLPMSPIQTVTHVTGIHQLCLAETQGFEPWIHLFGRMLP